MATLATFLRKNEYAVETSARLRPVKENPLDAFKLRGIPNDDVYFYCKRIDNSRLVRQSDPSTKGQCWSAIAAACVVTVLAGSVMAPKVGTILAGYKVQKLKAEQSVLIDERRNLDVEEAGLLSPGRLDGLARQQQLNAPLAGQVVHLQPRGDGAVAANLKHSHLKAR